MADTPVVKAQREKVTAVIGLARTGVPAARHLRERGQQVLGYDDRPLEALSQEARALAGIGVELHTGEHKYAGLQRCDCVILSPGLKVHHEPLRSLIGACEARGTEVIGELELAARHCRAPMIAVTGTKGKSTTVRLIASMMQACGIDALPAGNTGTPLIAELPRLEPESWAVVEVSSFQLERAPTLKPRVAVLLDLLADHQDYHPSLEQYWATKLKLFAHQSSHDVAVWNVDDPRVADLLGQRGTFAGWTSNRRARHLESSAMREDTFVCRQGPHLGYRQPAFVPVIDIEAIPLHGQHNWSNVAAALAAMAAALGVTEAVAHRAAIAAAIAGFQSLPHRLEVVGEFAGLTWINDSQATIPDAAERALEAFPPPVTLIAGGRDKLDNPSGYDTLGRAIARHAHLLITIGEAAPLIAGAARQAGFAADHIVDARTLTNAVEQAIIGTPGKGTVLFSPACASFDQFTSFEERGVAFRAAVAALSGRGHQSPAPVRQPESRDNRPST